MLSSTVSATTIAAQIRDKAALSYAVGVIGYRMLFEQLVSRVQSEVGIEVGRIVERVDVADWRPAHVVVGVAFALGVVWNGWTRGPIGLVLFWVGFTKPIWYESAIVTALRERLLAGVGEAWSAPRTLLALGLTVRPSVARVPIRQYDKAVGSEVTVNGMNASRRVPAPRGLTT
jgi:hypothetical protein